jgi:hypothetical protein
MGVDVDQAIAMGMDATFGDREWRQNVPAYGDLIKRMPVVVYAGACVSSQEENARYDGEDNDNYADHRNYWRIE